MPLHSALRCDLQAGEGIGGMGRAQTALSGSVAGHFLSSNQVRHSHHAKAKKRMQDLRMQDLRAWMKSIIYLLQYSIAGSHSSLSYP